MTSTRQRLPGVLTVNAGSSSLRLASYLLEPTPRCVADARMWPAPAQNPAVMVDAARTLLVRAAQQIDLRPW